MLTLYQYFTLFAVYSFVGWCFEVVICSVDTGHFVNRGFLNGPVCPIYGFGMLAIITVLTPFTDSLPALFAGSMVLCTFLEFITGWRLKKLFHTTWWDYSAKPFNLGGYICLQMSLAWGLGGIIMMNFVHPLVMFNINIFSGTLGRIFLVLFYAVFAIDIVATVLTITNLNKDLRRLNSFAQAVHRQSERMAQRLGDAAIKEDARMKEKREEQRLQLELLKEDFVHKKHFGRKRLFKAFPRMHHIDFDEILNEAKKYHGIK